jgi:hypothetical protein
MNWHEELRHFERIQKGTAPLDREWMIRALNEMSRGPSPFQSLKDLYAIEQAWVAAVKPDWLDLLLSVFADPPPEGERDHAWDTSTYSFFDDVIRRFPTQAFEKIIALLPTQNDGLRPYLICGLVSTGLPEARVWLQPFVDNIESLPLEELEQLSEVGAPFSNEEQHQILLRIRDKIPPIHDEQHDEQCYELRCWRWSVEERLNHTRKQLDKAKESGS